MVHHMENLLAIMNVYMCNLKRIYVTLCVFEGESEREGFIALFFYARDGMNLRVCVCVCVCVRACLNECR